MSVERSRQLGQALMGGTALSLLLFIIGITRRSYAALALPVFAGLAVISGLAFWVGYTMATTQWEEEEVPVAGEEQASPTAAEVPADPLSASAAP